MLLMGYSLLTMTRRKKSKKKKKSGVESVPVQSPQERSGKQRISQMVTGGRSGGYVTYLLSLPPKNTRSSLMGLMKRICRRFPAKDNACEAVIPILWECPNLFVIWSF